jgi:replicative DNA helicase
MQTFEETGSGQSTPHNDQAERQVLSALLQRPDRLHDVVTLLKHEDFFVRRNGLIYEALIELSDKNMALDVVTLQAYLKAQGKLGDVGGSEYLSELLPEAFGWENVTKHAGLVGHLATLRNLISILGEGIESARQTPPDGESVRALCDECESNVFGVSEGRDPSGAKNMGDLLTGVFQKIDQQSGRGDLTGLPSGFYDLDDMLGGFNPGELTVIAARPSMGKTAFVLNIMEHVTLNPPAHLEKPPVVLFFSLEMGSLSIVQRMLCSRARVDAHRLRSGKIDTNSYQDLTRAAGELEASKLLIDDTPGLSVMALRSRARRVKHKQGLDMIVIDYMQLMGAKAENRQQEISLISRSLKELGRELEVPVLALSQLSRGVESREDKRPLLSDLRESGSIEQDADVVMMLYRAEYYAATEENKGKAEVIVAKQRNGPTGNVDLQFKGSILRFENMAPSTVEALQI